ncbi:hypothetical protein [Streptomyces rimosus]|uniref:hypothetical protein n=1 Tax=Streptomyces rimosus TaxID=1927 RepID=UPI00067E46C7|nr:hypothetical protein [Streptomyces rimosus]
MLRAVDAAPSAARAAISTGWALAALTIVGVIASMTKLLRNAADIDRFQASETQLLAQEVALARNAWQKALMEHGILPFLRQSLTDPADADIRDPSRCVPRRGSVSQVQSRDHSQPDPTSQADDPPATSQPRFSHPDYGGADEESG